MDLNSLKFFTKRVLIILITLFLLCPFLYGQKQKGIIKGKIIDGDGNPAIGISVELKKIKRRTLTDNNGVFVFQHLPELKDTLIIPSVYSKPVFFNVVLHPDEILNMGIIRLRHDIQQLQTVEIIGRNARSYKSDYSFFGSKTETPSINIPQSISTITKELINDKMEFTLKDAVDVVAGVNQYSGFDEYTIRGLRAENARDINGLRGYNTTYTSSMLVNIERIEVIKGPTATLYGNCDPGGTINLVTKKPLNTKKAEINFYAGSWDHYRAEGDITGPLNKSKKLLYRFNAGYDHTGSFRNNEYAKSYEVAPSLTFIPNDRFKVNFDFSLSHINTVLDRGQPGYENDNTLKSTPISLSLIQKGDYLKETDVASNVTLSYKLNDRLSFNAGYLNYLTQQKVGEHGLNAYTSADSVDLYYTNWNYNSQTNTLTSYLTYKFNSGKAAHNLLFGYDYVMSKVDLDQQYYELPGFGTGSGVVGLFSLKNPLYPQRPVSSYKVSSYEDDKTEVDDNVYHTRGIYLQDQISINKWKFLLSLREEFYKGNDDDSVGRLKQNVFLPRAGIVYSLQPNLSLYATYNKGFDPFEISTATQIFDAPYKPIVSQLLEAGIKGNFFTNKLSASLALYQLNLKNVAVNANDINNPDLFIQQGENRSRGIELEASGNILSNLSIFLSYAYNESKIIKSKIPSQVGMISENAPRNTSNSYIKYTFEKGFLKGFGISAGHSSVSLRNTLDPEVTLPGYLTINTGLQYRYKHFKIAANFNNITNKVYWTGGYNSIYKWPGEPSNFILNLQYAFDL
ncbi:MAG: TonB-dependent siderophore receptor [Ginsengibacter sp.]